MPTATAELRATSVDLLTQHYGLARAIAKRTHARLPRGVDLDDLVSVAVMGLMEAADRFDPSRGVCFKSFAKHRIQGAIIDIDQVYPRWSDAEFYGYSVAWLIYGGLLLALAIWRRLPALRHAAAGIIVLVVFKVFLGDAQDLQGLYRFASFLGLGLTLLALGWLYQRMLRRAES